jgi:hypothetical protein
MKPGTAVPAAGILRSRPTEAAAQVAIFAEIVVPRASNGTGKPMVSD